MSRSRYCRPRQRRPWNLRGYDIQFYALTITVGVQGVRLLSRPTLLDGVVFVACVVALAPWENWF